MNENLKTYQFVLSLAIVCALLLSLTNSNLKEKQKYNIEVDRQKNVLKCAGFDVASLSSEDIVENYKRASNILNSEKNNEGDEILGSADPGLFKNQYEKDLYKKINDIKRNFTSIGLETDFQGQLSLLASAKKEV